MGLGVDRDDAQAERWLQAAALQGDSGGQLGLGVFYAGGYGAPIVSGLALNDMPTILTGAIPAALMALVAHGVFELLGVVLIPPGLRRRS